jgi:hypothetical protein
MSTFKCGLRRFDGHGTSSYRPTNTAATKEMETAYSRMMRLRDQQDRGEYTVQTTEYRPERDEPKKVVPNQQITEQPQNSRFLTYSLSDANPNKNTE